MMTLDTFDLLDNGAVQLRFVDEDDIFHREVRYPGGDISDLPEDVRTAITAHWTPARVAAYEAEQAAARVPPPLTEADFEEAIQHHLDRTAQARRYRDGFAIAGYVTSAVPQFAAEAQAFIEWRDAVWLYAYAELDKVTAEPPQRAVPTIEDFIGELPPMRWPQEGEEA